MIIRVAALFAFVSIAFLGCSPSSDEPPVETKPEEAPQENAPPEQAATDPETIPVNLAGSAVESMKDELLKPAADAKIPEGWEPGNLSEFGASELLTESDWLRAMEASKKEPILLFKHSTECPISGGAYRRLGSYLKESGDDAPKTYLVKVIERRPVSQKIEADVKVKHESPQAILLKDGNVFWNTSHEDITQESVRTAFSSLANSGTE